ncbi:carboxymuconolactone decarboxylase family protein [Streptomyces sp. NPDC093252]|uniref:carboxymuconolactone decarboxylase family protein n=1 Tax=Streptomyces sp. NPDC093252 TaxID=3154980 RepID=UPI00343E332A
MTSSFLHTEPLPPKSASGLVAEVYRQLGRDFGIDEPATFVVLSSAPAILAPTWALMRESLLAGPGDRTGKELVALGVSQANRCPFCVTAHTVLLHAGGDHGLAERVAGGGTPEDPGQARLVEWGRRSRTPGGVPEPLPFPREQAPAYLGTALSFHFINRITSALLKETVLPGGAERFRAVRRLAGRSLAPSLRREPVPGASLALLDGAPAGPPPAWADGGPVGPAYAALREAALMGAGLLDADDQHLVRRALRDWDGGHPSLTRQTFPGRAERPGARLALLAALAPYRITAEDVAAWRRPEHSDHCLVHLVAYGAFLAVDRIESAWGARGVGVGHRGGGAAT